MRDDTDLPNNAATDNADRRGQRPARAGDRRARRSPASRMRYASTPPGRATPTARSSASLGASATARAPRGRRSSTATPRPGASRWRCWPTTVAISTTASRQAIHALHVNQPPRAVAGPDRVVCPGEPVIFDGAASNDGDGALTRFRWDFGDGASADGAQVTHVFETPGVYEARARGDRRFRRDAAGPRSISPRSGSTRRRSRSPAAIGTASSAAPTTISCSMRRPRPTPTASR